MTRQAWRAHLGHELRHVVTCPRVNKSRHTRSTVCGPGASDAHRHTTRPRCRERSPRTAGRRRATGAGIRSCRRLSCRCLCCSPTACCCGPHVASPRTPMGREQLASPVAEANAGGRIDVEHVCERVPRPRIGSHAAFLRAAGLFTRAEPPAQRRPVHQRWVDWSVLHQQADHRRAPGPTLQPHDLQPARQIRQSCT